MRRKSPKLLSMQKVPKSGTFWWITIQDRNEMRKIGYARVSSTHQSLDRQLGALRAERVDVIYREKVSGKALFIVRLRTYSRLSLD